MAAIPRSYKNNIAEGRRILIFAIVCSVVLRVLYFLYFDVPAVVDSGGYLWKPFSVLSQYPLISFLLSGAFTAGMAFLASRINIDHLLIRKRTFLPPAFVLLLFSCHMSLVYMTAEYLASILFLYILYILFASYNSEGIKQLVSYKVSFILAFASFFVPEVLLYLPLLWIALIIMRTMNGKSLLTSLVSVFTLYFPAFSYYLFIGDMETFLQPFASFANRTFLDLPFRDFGIFQWIVCGISVILLMIIITDNFVNRHKDKIKVRAYLSLLDFIVVISVLLCLFLNTDSGIYLYISLLTGSLLLSHFFALAEEKISVWLFYIAAVFYFIICFLPFLSV